ncbi:hypothetical protein MNBD_GAMMA09-213 [hydrothermal vent metagenome]|uniref:PABS domain-containing protein n=1 Tax=hydrothermal vent metagenome TaxID=652676 RepID=A0A3B0XRT4_9ZZZZ
MYGGELIYKTSDEHGSIEVVDFQQKIRSMHFGNKTQQSAMLLSNPFILIHKYSQAMMLPLSWINPQRVLMLGLGSGSIVKYLYNYYPELIIDTVELRQKVIELATDYFLLPEDNERFYIYNESAFDWLNAQAQTKYDIIFVDMFLTSSTGKDITISVSTYIEKIYHLLNDNGVVVFNQLGDNVLSYPGISRLSELFSHQLYSINIESVNNILIATRGLIPESIDTGEFHNIEIDYMLPYRSYFNRLTPVL